MRWKSTSNRCFLRCCQAFLGKSNDASFVLPRNSAEGLFYLAGFILIYHPSLVGFSCSQSQTKSRRFLLRKQNTFIESESVNAVTYVSLLYFRNDPEVPLQISERYLARMCTFNRLNRLYSKNTIIMNLQLIKQFAAVLYFSVEAGVFRHGSLVGQASFLFIYLFFNRTVSLSHPHAATVKRSGSCTRALARRRLKKAPRGRATAKNKVKGLLS